MKATITTTPYPIDNNLNPFGDYIALMRVANECATGTFRAYWLIGRPNVSPKSITYVEYLSACENLAIRAGASLFIPPPV